MNPVCRAVIWEEGIGAGREKCLGLHVCGMPKPDGGEMNLGDLANARQCPEDPREQGQRAILLPAVYMFKCQTKQHYTRHCDHAWLSGNYKPGGVAD